MSLIRYLYIGNFETDGDFVRLEEASGKPILRRFLSQKMITSCFPGNPMTSQEVLRIPTAWPAWYENGYLLCKRDELAEDAVGFLHRVIKTFDCEIVDVGNGLLLPHSQVLPRTLIIPGDRRERDG
jgi:hypothetical protein